MARPERQNADYFPFYAKDGRTLFLLESKYGCKGTGFFTNVMRFLTLETHHHVSIQDETDRMYFFSKCHCDEESGMDMLNIMAKTDKINNRLWSLGVVASQNLLDSLSDAYRNRKNDIITMSEITEKHVTDVRNGVSDVGNPQGAGVSDAEKPQRKEKKRKEKKRKEKRFIPPKVEDVILYFTSKGYTEKSARKAWEYYNTADWHDATGKKVRNWKQKMIAVWFKDENKQGWVKKSSRPKSFGAIMQEENIEAAKAFLEEREDQ
ncbi:MAG: hypothetical protein JRC93_12360 [Deltaproteobacteria bacterium]|nr:hypothetical protein [Deltaproteobacteria bacterium]